jgi:hypothetical protein
MSFLNIRGKVVHCTDCDNYMVIEYEGGNKPTQIGDSAVAEQVRLNNEIMPEDYDFEKLGYYYHKGAICNNCIKRQHEKFKKSLFVKPDFVVLQYLEIVEMMYQNFTTIINLVANSFINELDAADLIKINNDLFQQIASARTGGVKKERLRLAEKFVNESKELLTEEVKKRISENEDFINSVQTGDSVSEEYDRAVISFLKFKGDIYVEIDCEAEDNLNPYIYGDTAVRKPTEIYGDTQFFEGPIEFDKENIIRLINDKRKFTLDSPEIIDELNSAAERVFKKLPHKLLELNFWNS